MAGEIFISYRRARDDAARRLEEVLRENGFAEYQVFRDVRGLFAGEAFDRQLADTLQRTRVVLLLLGEGDAPRHDTDDWVARELRAAMKAHRPILPVVLAGGEGETTREWPPEFRSILDMQSLDFTGMKDSEVQRLVGALRRYGVRPLQAAQQWRSILQHSPVAVQIDALKAFALQSTPGLMLLRGDAGTGRTHVIQQVARCVGEADAGRVLGLHRGLRSRLVGVDGAVMYDWIEGLLEHDSSLSGCILDLCRSGLEPRYLPRSVIERLDGTQRALLRRSATTSSQVGMAAGSVKLLEDLAARRPLVLMIDDVELADSGSQEIVRALANRLQQPDPPPVNLIIAAANSALLDLFLLDLGEVRQVQLTPDVRAMLTSCGIVDESVTNALVEQRLSPSQCVVYLRHLHEHDMLVAQDGRWALRTPVQLPSLTSVLDDELDNVLPSGLQQILEIGALCGTRFPVSVADRVAGAEGDGQETAERLLSYDPDETIVQRAHGRGPDRVGFASSMWWRHLRARHVLPSGAPSEPREVRRLAEALAGSIVASTECYDDWATVGFLFDSIDDNARSGAAFLRAARAARLDRAHEAARRGYVEAARRLELHALTSTPGCERAGELLRVAYCLFRAATVLADTSTPQPSAHLVGDRSHEGHGDPPRDLLDLTDWVLGDVDEELDAVAVSGAATDFDDVVTQGADVNSETVERLKLQWRSLSAFVAVERGRRQLRDSTSGTPAIRSFSRALLLGEAGLSGSLYHELIVAASAGLSLAFTREVTAGRGGEQAAAAFEHAARAAMIVRLSPYASVRAPHEVDRFAEASAWIEAAYRELAERLHVPALARPSNGSFDEDSLLAFLEASYRLVAPASRLDHARLLIERCRELAEHAADLSSLCSSRSFMRDVEMYAFSHDQFRYTNGARLLRLWRDLGESDSRQLAPGAENEWHNPVLLHGRLAALWLQHDVCVQRVIGDASFRRVRDAMDSHTVGAANLNESADSTFVRAVHLADMVASRPDDPELSRVWNDAFASGGLAPAYARAYALRAVRLRNEGKVVSPVTSSLVPH